MRRAVERSLKRSQQAFLDLIWPEIRGEICGGGELIPVESVSESEFADLLDIHSGVDAWQVVRDGQAGRAIRGLATRVQWTRRGESPYNTFTVRRSIPSGRPTEYDKRLAALHGERGYLLPYLTVQGYISCVCRSRRDGWCCRGQFVSAGVARTADVIAAVREETWRPNRGEDSTFYWVRFVWVDGIKAVGHTPRLDRRKRA